MVFWILTEVNIECFQEACSFELAPFFNLKSKYGNMKHGET